MPKLTKKEGLFLAISGNKYDRLIEAGYVLPKHDSFPDTIHFTLTATGRGGVTFARIHPGIAVFATVAFVTAVAIAVQISRERRLVETPVSVTPPARQQETPAGPLVRQQEMPSELMGRASVIDGDTIDIHGINGIDAPESRQTCEAITGLHVTP